MLLFITVFICFQLLLISAADQCNCPIKCMRGETPVYATTTQPDVSVQAEGAAGYVDFQKWQSASKGSDSETFSQSSQQIVETKTVEGSSEGFFGGLEGLYKNAAKWQKSQTSSPGTGTTAQPSGVSVATQTGAAAGCGPCCGVSSCPAANQSQWTQTQGNKISPQATCSSNFDCCKKLLQTITSGCGVDSSGNPFIIQQRMGFDGGQLGVRCCTVKVTCSAPGIKPVCTRSTPLPSDALSVDACKKSPHPAMCLTWMRPFHCEANDDEQCGKVETTQCAQIYSCV